MILAKTIDKVQEFRKTYLNRSIGFVSTMGFLHEGHFSLIKRSKSENNFTLVSIFVNPMQFHEYSDFSKYPKDLKKDLKQLEDIGVDLVFLPSEREIYPKNFHTKIEVGEISILLEGKSRSGHFTGVSTIVLKLFNIVAPQIAYFGKKDAQQLRVIQKMVEDLNLLLKIQPCDTIREKDGLAMSSRNKRLTRAQRNQAPLLYKTLCLAKEWIQNGERDPRKIQIRMLEILNEADIKPEYVSINDLSNLETMKNPMAGSCLISLAAYFGEVRLIDNVILQMNEL